MRIKGGYILLSRKIDRSGVMRMSPCTREIWIYLLRKVNHSDYKHLKRGENIFHYEDIQNDLCWYAGYRKIMYKKYEIAKSLRRLCDSNMIATTKATRGVLIKVLQYDIYQDAKNYEGNNEDIPKAMRKQRSGSRKYKNVIQECKEDNRQENNPVVTSSYTSFIENFNSIVGSSYRGDTKSQSAFLARLKSGYTLEDILKAVSNAKCDSYLMGDNPTKRRYLTPEYITRSDKLDQWLNNKKRETEVNILNQTK